MEAIISMIPRMHSFLASGTDSLSAFLAYIVPNRDNIRHGSGEKTRLIRLMAANNPYKGEFCEMLAIITARIAQAPDTINTISGIAVSTLAFL